MLIRNLLMICMLPFLIGCSNNELNSDCKRVDIAVFKTELEKHEFLQIIDVRTVKEYNNGSIENAKNINFYDANFNEQLKGLDKSLPTFVYCQSGGRSYKAMELMCELGFQMVYELEGGYSSWN